MKYFRIILSLSFLVSCAPIDTVKFSSLDTVVEPEGIQIAGIEPQVQEVPAFEREIASRVEEESSPRIGRKKVFSSVKAQASGFNQVGKNAYKEEAEPRVVTSDFLNVQPEPQEAAVEDSDKKVEPVVAEEDEASRVIPWQITRKDGKKVDIVFYVGWKHDLERTIYNHFFSGFKVCLSEFAKNVYKTGFLSKLTDLDWQWSHFNFSKKKSKIGALEWRGHILKKPVGQQGFRWEIQHVLNKYQSYYEDVFAQTVSPIVNDSYKFGKRVLNLREDNVFYDAPFIVHNNKRSLKNPLPGLEDLLSANYENSVRKDSRVEVFLLTGYFPKYDDEVIKSFLKKHKQVRFHLLFQNDKRKEYDKDKLFGSALNMVKYTGGAMHPLCGGSSKMGNVLADIIKN